MPRKRNTPSQSAEQRLHQTIEEFLLLWRINPALARKRLPEQRALEQKLFRLWHTEQAAARKAAWRAAA